MKPPKPDYGFWVAVFLLAALVIIWFNLLIYQAIALPPPQIQPFPTHIACEGNTAYKCCWLVQALGCTTPTPTAAATTTP